MMFAPSTTITTAWAHTPRQQPISKRQRAFERRQAAEAGKRQEAPQVDPLVAVRAIGRVRMPIWAAQIVIEVAGRHEVDPIAMVSRSMARRHVHARNEALYLIRSSHPTYTPSFPRIADWFGREHTGILWAVARHAQRTGAKSITGIDVELGAAKRRQRHRRAKA